MMAKPHGSAFTPPIHEDGDSIDGAWCRAHDAAVDAPFLIRDAKAELDDFDLELSQPLRQLADFIGSRQN